MGIVKVIEVKAGDKSVSRRPSRCRADNQAANGIIKVVGSEASNTKIQACGSKGCWTGVASFFGLMSVVGIILVAVVITTAPTDKTNGGEICAYLKCQNECLHADGSDDAGNIIREACCDDLEDCGPRVGKWFSGLFFLIFGIIMFSVSVCGIKACACCGKDATLTETSQPDVVQAQEVEVSLTPGADSAV
jgi:hypothetical protein